MTAADRDGVLLAAAGLSALRAAPLGLASTRLQVGRFVVQARQMWRAALALWCALDAPDAARGAARNADVAGLVEAMGLDGAWMLRPLVSGAEVAAAFGRRSGRWIQPVLADCLDAQLAHPDWTRDDCLTFILSRKSLYSPS